MAAPRAETAGARGEATGAGLSLGLLLRLAQYDRAIAHWEEEAKKAEGDAKEKLEFKLTSLRAARAQEIAFYANLRCKVELIGDPRTRIAVYSQPLSKKVRLYDFVRNLRRSLERDFSGLKLTENGVRDRRFQRQGWEGVRFTGEGTPKQDPEKERRWIRLLHYRKVTKQGRGMHVWIHGFAPTWRVERDFLLEVERLLAGLRVSG